MATKKPAKSTDEANSPQTKKIGRPTSFNMNTAKVICIRLGQGESLQSICRDEDMPGRATVYEWLLDFPDFTDMYTRAREEQAESHADAIVDIADETPETVEVRDKEGNIVDIRLDSAYIAWQKNRIEARKWTAMKLKPRKYGDKVQVGGDADNPAKIQVDVSLFDAILQNMESKRQTAKANA